MIKRPLNARFSDAVREDRKVTTIRDKPWPVGKPVMLYNWSGRPYGSPQIDVCAVEVFDTRSITITHKEDGELIFAYGQVLEKPLHECEGFESRFEMAEWFRSLITPGQSVTKQLMRFRRL